MVPSHPLKDDGVPVTVEIRANSQLNDNNHECLRNRLFISIIVHMQSSFITISMQHS